MIADEPIYSITSKITTTTLSMGDRPGDLSNMVGFCGKRGALLVPESKARQGGIASPIATSRNTAIGCERRASRWRIHGWWVYQGSGTEE